MERLTWIQYRMWEIEMADYIRGDERREYERLKAEKAMLEYVIAKENKK